MVKLNELVEDVISLIIEKLQHDHNSLYSCLLVNKTLCEAVLPILWKDPWKYTERIFTSTMYDDFYMGSDKKSKYQRLLIKVIASHLSNETKKDLKIKGWKQNRRRPLINYISFIRYLDLYELEGIINLHYDAINVKKFKIPIMRNKIFELFISRNTKFTHLYIPSRFNHQIHHIPGAEHSFSTLKFVFCDLDDTNQNLLEALAGTSKSIKKLMIFGKSYSKVAKLIEAQRNLNSVFIQNNYSPYTEDRKPLEISFFKHTDTIRHLKIDWLPTTKILSYLVNLVSLEISSDNNITNWNHLKNVSLPVLRNLIAQRVPSEILTRIIESSKGHLTEVSVDYRDDDKRYIKAIYQNCPNLKYLRLFLQNNDFSELEELLINCQSLDGLVIKDYNCVLWDNLFKILTKSSPISLFKFKFIRSLFSFEIFKLESLKLFFDDWKDRHPILLKTNLIKSRDFDLTELIEKYKAEGLVKNYDNDSSESFEWIQKSFYFLNYNQYDEYWL